MHLQNPPPGLWWYVAASTHLRNAHNSTDRRGCILSRRSVGCECDLLFLCLHSSQPHRYIDGYGVCAPHILRKCLLIAKVHSNKWVLNNTDIPLFFLWSQLAIAVLLFVASDALRLLPDRLTFNLETCKGLIPMVGLNVFGLRSVQRALALTSADHPTTASATIPSSMSMPRSIRLRAA